MEYQDFLQGTGATDDLVTEEDFETLIQLVIEDRRDLFPSDEAAVAHYNSFGLKGFSDEFITALDEIVERLRDVKLLTGVGQHRIHKFVELAVDQI